MNKPLILVTILLLEATVVFCPTVAFSQSYQGITIHTDGSITPSTAPIRIDGNEYILTSDINGPVTVERVGIVIEGANHTLQGPGKDQNLIAITLTAWNVTVENIRITGWRAGVYGAFDNNTIAKCFFANNSQSIAIYGGDYVVEENTLTSSSVAVFIDSDDNLIAKNQIAFNTWAFDLLKGNKTTITQNNVTNNNVILAIASYTGYNVLYDNNFISNDQPLSIPFGGPTLRGITPISPAGLWDNGRVGNYWNDYTTRYPNATEIGKTGIGNTPYTIEDATTDTVTYANGTQNTQIVILGTAVDHYPLVASLSLTFTSSPQPTVPAQETTTLMPTSSPSPSSTPSPSVPEFPSWIILSALITGTLLYAAICRKRTKLK